MIENLAEITPSLVLVLQDGQIRTIKPKKDLQNCTKFAYGQYKMAVSGKIINRETTEDQKNNLKKMEEMLVILRFCVDGQT